MTKEVILILLPTITSALGALIAIYIKRIENNVPTKRGIIVLVSPGINLPYMLTNLKKNNIVPKVSTISWQNAVDKSKGHNVMYAPRILHDIELKRCDWILCEVSDQAFSKYPNKIISSSNLKFIVDIFGHDD